jgi:hypothetical protein
MPNPTPNPPRGRPRGTGRPIKPPEERKTARFATWLHPADKAWLQARPDGPTAWIETKIKEERAQP